MTKKIPISTSLLIASTLSSALWARDADRFAPGIPVPRHREEHRAERPLEESETVEFPEEFRSIDGHGNNLEEPALGAARQPMLRIFDADYADASGSPAGPERPSARAVSNAVVAGEQDLPNRRGATDYLWQWGQFLDHDIVETPTIEPEEPFDIRVPMGDIWFDPNGTGTQIIPMNRSYYEDHSGVREQVNENTSFIDASNVYGSDSVRAYALRKLDGSGELKTSSSEHGDLLPYNEGGEENAPDSSGIWFLAGDVRANEQVGLTAMHTLFVREHNHWAAEFKKANPAAGDDETYEFARMIVGAEMQHITYKEFLPLLLGARAIPPYQGYDGELDPTVANEFATAAYRLGHSLLSPEILRLNGDGETIEDGNLSLSNAFFDPALTEDYGIDAVLRGLAGQRCQELDITLVDDLRNFLFGPPGSGGFDLASLNIQRGRDHGVPSYNSVRAELGMPKARNFRDVTPDRDLQGKLASVYDSVDDIDLWVGGLCEPHVRGAMLGPVLHKIISKQFIALRDGDRFWYESALDPSLLEIIEQQTLSKIIRRNTEIGAELPDHVFLTDEMPAPPSSAPDGKPSRHR
ncbi:peroxidase family protein [Haloferula chungangensis]|uniref:Peroxidase family protein n=1 Tax=Haloferula chungangensis TaxID=1048331 RepID=A0ABW2L728_9BACT